MRCRLEAEPGPPTGYSRTVPITVTPVTAVVGAELNGVDLAAPLDHDTIAQIEAALYEYGVLFFRNQPLTPDQHLATARQFGEIDVAPFGPKLDTHPEITVLDQIEPVGGLAARWHSDNTYEPDPPLGSLLRVEHVPPLGGDTCFSSSYAAFEALSPAMQTMLEELTALHDLTYTLTRAVADGHADDSVFEMQERFPAREHPVVRHHPISDRKALYVNANFTTRLVGLTERENATVLPFLIDHVRSPDFQCRFRWERDSVAFWDNRAVQHYAVPDYAERRIMHRVTIRDRAGAAA